MKLQKGVLPLRDRRAFDQKAVEDNTMKAAKMFEKHFLREMVKAMRKTVPKSGFVQESMAERIFSEKLDNQYVEQWGDKGGIGLSKMIYDQVMARFGRQMGIRGRSIQQPRGPIPMERTQMHGVPTAAPKAGPIAFNMKKVADGKPADVLMPWPGILVKTDSLGGELSRGVIAHENGLKSEFVFKGLLKSDSSQQTIGAGQKIGLMSANAESFSWRVSQLGEGLQSDE